MIEVFEKPVDEVNFRYAKYFTSIVRKGCACREIMAKISMDRVMDLTEQLLLRLLIENLEKAGENKE